MSNNKYFRNKNGPRIKLLAQQNLLSLLSPFCKMCKLLIINPKNERLRFILNLVLV